MLSGQAELNAIIRGHKSMKTLSTVHDGPLQQIWETLGSAITIREKKAVSRLKFIVNWTTKTKKHNR